MPEHMLLRPVFYDGELVAFAATIGHMAEIGAVTVGSFAATATEVYQEGLRLPPVKLVRAGEPVEDVWKIILSNHRTPALELGRPARDDRLARARRAAPARAARPPRRRRSRSRSGTSCSPTASG